MVLGALQETTWEPRLLTTEISWGSGPFDPHCPPPGTSAQLWPSDAENWQPADGRLPNPSSSQSGRKLVPVSLLIKSWPGGHLLTRSHHWTEQETTFGWGQSTCSPSKSTQPGRELSWRSAWDSQWINCFHPSPLCKVRKTWNRIWGKINVFLSRTVCLGGTLWVLFPSTKRLSEPPCENLLFGRWCAGVRCLRFPSTKWQGDLAVIELILSTQIIQMLVLQPSNAVAR